MFDAKMYVTELMAEPVPTQALEALGDLQLAMVGGAAGGNVALE